MKWMLNNPRGIVGFFLFGLLAFLFWRLPGRSIIALFHDDSFFYLKTAANIANGKGSTFDGINFTNGYHPLYMAFLAMVSLLYPIHGLNGIYLVMLIDSIFFVGFLLIVDNFFIHFGWPNMFRLPLGLAFVFFMGFNDFGLESRLALLIAWSFLKETYSSLYEGQGSWKLAAFLSVLLFLARIDFALLLVFVVFPLVVMPGSGLGSPKGRGAWGILAAFVAGVAGYIGVNVFWFSALTSVSSHLKMGWPGLLASGWTNLGGPGVRFRLLFCLVGGGVACWAYLREVLASRGRAEKDTQTNIFLAAINGYVFFYMLILMFFAKGVGGWYFLFPISVVLFSTVKILSKYLSDSMQTKLVLLIISFLIMAASVSYAAKKAWNAQDDILAISDWLRQNLPAETPIFQVDASGKTGYLSERCIVNGDGLINSWEYVNFLKAGNLQEYLKKYKIEYFLLTEYAGENELSVVIPGWQFPPQQIRFSDTAQRLHREGRFLLLRDRPELISVKPL